VSAFAGKKILVTGGAGFLGGPIIRNLVERGARPEDLSVPEYPRFDLRLPAACAEVVAGQEIPINDLIAMVCDMTGYGGKIVRDLSRPDGQPRRCLDTSRAKEKFGFVADTPFKEGLRRTIAWYEQARRDRS